MPRADINNPSQHSPQHGGLGSHQQLSELACYLSPACWRELELGPDSYLAKPFSISLHRFSSP